jgi:uncharacterized cupin superfamily protein
MSVFATEDEHERRQRLIREQQEYKASRVNEALEATTTLEPAVVDADQERRNRIVRMEMSEITTALGHHRQVTDEQRRDKLVREQQEYKDMRIMREAAMHSIEERPMVPFSSASIDDFTVDDLMAWGPLKTADWGNPQCFSRLLYNEGEVTVGAWHCTAGGFSVTDLPDTEVWYVLAGEGKLVDADGKEHYWGSGDLVVLPKGWSGRWDVIRPIHKVFVVHSHRIDHDHAPNPPDGNHDGPTRAVVERSKDLVSRMSPPAPRPDADYGEPRGAFALHYDVGPTSFGVWTCTPGGFTGNRSKTKVFHVLEGVCFLTNSDGSSRRIASGDTVVLPKGWSGRWDVVQTIKIMSVFMEE